MKNFDVGYSWMPAAHDAYPGWDYITITRNLPIKPSIEKKGQGYYMFRRGDTAYLCFTTTSVAAKKALDGKIVFDRFAHEHRHCSHLMFNASDAPRKPVGRKHATRMASRQEYTILQDSGGYQLVSGAKLFVDPHSVSAAHNIYAHEGVGLDIPTGSLSNIDLIVASAKIQNLNNKIIKKNLQTDVALFATSQGVSPEGRRQYLDIMLESEFDGITIAGLRSILGVYTPTPVQIMLHLLYVVYRTRDRVSRYHILGVSTFTSMLALACAAEFLKIRITSDSARHILSGAGGTTLSSPNLAAFQSGAGTRKKGGVLGHRGGYLNFCSCRLCSSLVFDTMYSESRLLQTHAFSSIANASSHVRKEARFILAEDPCLSLGSSFAKAIELLQTVNSAKEAFKLLTIEIATVKKTPSLFDRSSADGQIVLPTKTLEKQMWSVIDRYKQYHRTGKIDPTWIRKEK